MYGSEGGYRLSYGGGSVSHTVLFSYTDLNGGSRFRIIRGYEIYILEEKYIHRLIEIQHRDS